MSKVAIVIGRFQPVHNAHIEMLRRAAGDNDKVIVIVGSANKPRTYKNPWTCDERIAMILEAIDPIMTETGAKFVMERNIDTIYNDDAWATRIQNIVAKHTTAGDEIFLYGHKKDYSSFYLDMFKQWKFVEQERFENLSATQIRQVYFSPEICNLNWFKGVLPDTTIRYLTEFKETDAYQTVAREKDFLEKYRKKFEVLPYAPTFVTVDAVVVQSGCVLMVKRGADPGNGLWALPGGFLDAKSDRSLEDAALRELDEETGIKVTKKILRGSIKQVKVFDAIDRSQRGRTITHAFFIRLENSDYPLPKVKGSSQGNTDPECDADEVKWIPLSSLKGEEIYEDHLDIIDFFTGSVR